MAADRHSLSGRLLVSSPHLWDPNFRRTVVFIVEHTEDGAMGLVLNHPTDIPATGLLDEWDAVIIPPPIVFRGGPVRLETAIGLGVTANESGIGLIDLSEPSTGVVAVRVFAGYSGWGAGQLEDEMAGDSWLVVDVEDGDLLSPDPARLWERVVDRLPGSGRLLRTMPSDPGLN